MDGIEAIIEHILADAREKASQIEAAASEQVAQIVSEAEKECAVIRQAGEQKASQAAETLLNRVKSQASLESRRALLESRQDLIDEVIAEATSQLGQLSTPEKKTLYLQMIQSAGASGGMLVANAQDQAVMQEVVQTLGQGWELRNEPGTFTGGIILQRGRIEENLTFDLLVRNLRPQLAALAAGILFPDAG